MKAPLIYQWKKDCEKRIQELKQEIRGIEVHIERAYESGLTKDHPQMKRWYFQLERLEDELVSEYESLEDYKGRIINYEWECEYL